jgi:preprotein translocase subunit YajC
MFPLISEAHAQATNAAGEGGIAGILSSSQMGAFLPLIPIMAIFYFLMVRPQQQEAKKLKERLSAVKRGDRVLTAGGIIGTVQKTRDGSAEIEVEIAPNVRVTVLRDTLSNVLNAGGETK